MKLRVAKKVLKADAVRRRAMFAVRSSAAHVWLMDQVFGRYRQSTLDRAGDRFSVWCSSQARWAVAHWDEITPEPVPESAIERMRAMIAAATANKQGEQT